MTGAVPGATGAGRGGDGPATRSLAGSIRRRQAEGLLPVLSEIKVRSPKEGDLLRGRAPEALAAVMAAAPIAGLSVVTELIHFGGDLDIVRRVRPLVPVPILRKDFTHSEGDLDETLAVGDGDTVLVPRGYHTVSAPPGYDLYYLNVMAGPTRAWAIANDPDHEWMLQP